MDDTFLMSRIQFAANITFHILFPSITIALGWVILFFKLRFNRSQDSKWMDAYFFFTKVFALTFSLGVVSGVTMSFQFGTNWPGFMNTVGNIAGPLLAYEVLTAFFLEASFLGIMLFGFRRVKPWVHTLATFLVAAGTTLSAFWILALNSWMHTPAGFEMRDGVAHATDWWLVIFNPSMPYRFAHALLASGLTAAFFVAGISAYRMLKGDRGTSAQATLRTGLLMAVFLMPLQLIVGDRHGLVTHKYQPAKLAAMEGLWQGRSSAPLTLFALPDSSERKNHYAVEVPKLGSLLVTRTLDGYVAGISDFKDHPPVAPVFWSFRIMVGVGMLMLLVASVGTWTILRKRNFSRVFLTLLVGMTFSGWVATVAGWYVTEIGRQPWLVQGILKAREAVGNVAPTQVGISLALYLSLYVFLLIAYVVAVFFMAQRAVSGSVRNEVLT